MKRPTSCLAGAAPRIAGNMRTGNGRAYPSHLRRRGPQGRARPRGTLTHMNHTFARVFVRSLRLESTSSTYPSNFRRSCPQGRPRRRWRSPISLASSPHPLARSPEGTMEITSSKSPFVIPDDTIVAVSIEVTPYPSHLRRSCPQVSSRPRWSCSISLVPSPQSFAGSAEAAMDITSSQSRFVIPDDTIVAVSIEVTRCPSDLRCSCSQVSSRARWRSPYIPRTFVPPLRRVGRGRDGHHLMSIALRHTR